MRIAGSILLGVIGAILYFAVDIDVQGVSLPTVGVILMIAAAVWFLIELIVGFTGRRTTSTSTVRGDDGTVEERETTTRNSNPDR